MNPGEIPMETVFFSSFLNTVAATQAKNRFQRQKSLPERFLLQQLFVLTTRIGRAVYV